MAGNPVKSEHIREVRFLFFIHRLLLKLHCMNCFSDPKDRGARKFTITDARNMLTIGCFMAKHTNIRFI